MGRLFGTDGIRGIANRDLTPTLATALGRAVGQHLAADGRPVVIGQDTRRSGDMLSAAVAAGVMSAGADSVHLGVVTTACVAYACADAGVAAGVMVSASHNPADDNGLKVLVGGYKLDDTGEEALESLMADPSPDLPGNSGLGRWRQDPAALASYREHLRSAAGDALAGLRIGLDCANGSASHLVPSLFRELGADVVAIGVDPDGTNINLDCGATNPQRLAALVRDEGLALGFAFDGDADRMIAIDGTGRVLDGDAVLGICATARLAAGRLRHGLLVCSVLSNGGLERAVTQAGGRVVRTAVGDRHVMTAMLAEDAELGGEQSGHIIFRDLATTGDGILTAIQLARTVRDAGGATLAQLADRIPRLPQVMLNSAVRRADAWADDRVLTTAVAAAELRLRGRGRVLVRPSGTEPKIRIMVEGDDAGEINEIARHLQRIAETQLS
ncbi:MAG TPA: phosphoglucosamine mutase [Candidatus Limnocylindria bacterium]|nr:phosphoglucosamine mutase [Candidatus Limnocylindria bacterium]